MNPRPVLVSHALCPYVQRAAIVMTEKRVKFERRDVDLAHKPEWFLDVSPRQETPVLLVDDQAIFESAVICEIPRRERAACAASRARPTRVRATAPGWSSGRTC
jgi:glutaredoxin